MIRLLIELFHFFTKSDRDFVRYALAQEGPIPKGGTNLFHGKAGA